jgi:hypothetical protein
VVHYWSCSYQSLLSVYILDDMLCVCNKVSATLYRALDLVHKALKIGPSPTLCGPINVNFQ